MTPLATKTYELLRTVPKGKVTTYKALAHALGTTAYRAIGQFMRNNPYSFETCPERSRRIPCHRVVASDGKLGGFMGKKSGDELDKKIALLRDEGVTVVDYRIKNFKKKLFTF
jgi:methylated-DNA-[protein]-cysteine S-methyltransferase